MTNDSLLVRLKRDVLAAFDNFTERQGPEHLWYNCVISSTGIAMFSEGLFVNSAKNVIAVDPLIYNDPDWMIRIRFDPEASALSVVDFGDEPFGDNEELQSLIASHKTLSYEEKKKSLFGTILKELADSIEAMQDTIAEDLYLTEVFSVLCTMETRIKFSVKSAGISYKTNYLNATPNTPEYEAMVQTSYEKAMVALRSNEEAVHVQRERAQRMMHEISGKWQTYSERRKLLRELRVN